MACPRPSGSRPAFRSVPPFLGDQRDHRIPRRLFSASRSRWVPGFGSASPPRIPAPPSPPGPTQAGRLKARQTPTVFVRTCRGRVLGIRSSNDPVSRIDADVAGLVGARENDVLLQPKVSMPWKAAAGRDIADVERARRLGIPDQKRKAYPVGAYDRPLPAGRIRKRPEEARGQDRCRGGSIPWDGLLHRRPHPIERGKPGRVADGGSGEPRTPFPILRHKSRALGAEREVRLDEEPPGQLDFPPGVRSKRPAWRMCLGVCDPVRKSRILPSAAFTRDLTVPAGTLSACAASAKVRPLP